MTFWHKWIKIAIEWLWTTEMFDLSFNTKILLYCQVLKHAIFTYQYQTVSNETQVLLTPYSTYWLPRKCFTPYRTYWYSCQYQNVSKKVQMFLKLLLLILAFLSIENCQQKNKRVSYTILWKFASLQVSNCQQKYNRKLCHIIDMQIEFVYKYIYCFS